MKNYFNVFLISMAIFACGPKIRMQSTTSGLAEFRPNEETGILGEYGLEIYKNSDETIRIHSIFQKIRSVRRRTNKIYLRIADDPRLLAFSTPQYIVVISTGLLRNLKSEEQIALIFAHEIAHFDIGHHDNLMTVGPGTKISKNTIREMNNNNSIPKFSLGVKFLYSRLDETEADKLGATYARAAGYRRDSLVEAFDGIEEIFTKAKTDNSSQLYAKTHPSSATRRKYFLQSVNNIYEEENHNAGFFMESGQDMLARVCGDEGRNINDGATEKIISNNFDFDISFDSSKFC